MAELVDAADLKSADYYNLKGSSPFIPIENFFKKKLQSPPSLLQIERDQSVDRIKAQEAFLSILWPQPARKILRKSLKDYKTL